MSILANYVKQFGALAGTAPINGRIQQGAQGQPDEPEQRISEATLDSLGRRNELMRNRFVDIVSKANELLALRGAFVEAARDVGSILTESENAGSSLVESDLMLRREEEAHGELKTRYRAMHEEAVGARQEIQVLRTEIARFEELAKGREARILQLQSEAIAERSAVIVLRNELQVERDAAQRFGEQMRNAQAQIGQGDSLISNLQNDLSEISASLSLNDFHLKATQSSLYESHADARALRDLVSEREQKSEILERRLTETQFELQDRNRRLQSAETALEELRREADEAKQNWQGLIEARTDANDNLRSQIDELGSRAEAGEKLLGEARAELQARSEELRKSERRAEDVEARYDMIEQRLMGLSVELGAANAGLAEVESSRTRLANRAHALIRVMKDKKVLLEAAEQRVELLEDKLVRDAAQFDDVGTRLRAKIVALTEENNKEKLARTIAVGALEAARARPIPPRPEIDLQALMAQVDLSDENDNEPIVAANEPGVAAGAGFMPSPPNMLTPVASTPTLALQNANASSDAAPEEGEEAAAPIKAASEPRPSMLAPSERPKLGKRPSPSANAPPPKIVVGSR